MRSQTNPIGEIVWWSFFLSLGIWGQRFLPGIDVLVIGLLIALQEGKIRCILWLLPVIILLQEGMGGVPFGSALLWYGGVILLFCLGRWLFEAENFLFMFLLSLCLGGLHYALSDMMASLQRMHIPNRLLVDDSILQALFVPFAWGLAQWFRKRFMNNAHTF